MSYEKTDAASQRRSRWTRVAVLAGVLVAVTAAAQLHQTVQGSGKPVPVDALCPFGGLETMYSILAGGGYLEKVAASSVILLLGALGLTLVFSRSFCGQICPLGALQGAFGWVGRRFIRRRPKMPAALDRPARWLKYVVLAVFAVWTWVAGALVMRPYDPWATWAHITSAELVATFGVGLGVLVVSLIGSIVYDRFFCKYLCPMGALLAIFNKASVLRIKRSPEACIDCGKCDKACPMNVTVSTADEVVSAECISCNECVNACPAKDALEVKFGAKAVRPLAATGVVAGILAAAIIVATAAGQFRWTMPTLAESAATSSGETAGSGFDGAAVRGYMSMGEVSKVSGVPRAEFTRQFGVPEGELDKPMKEIKETYGFTPEDVGAWAAEQAR